MTGTTKSTKTGKAYEGFSAEERAAMKERAKELKASANRADAEKAQLEKIAELSEPDRSMASRIHELVAEHAPSLAPKTWYGMPGWAKDGKILCFFQPAEKFEHATRPSDSTTWHSSTTVLCGPSRSRSQN